MLQAQAILLDFENVTLIPPLRLSILVGADALSTHFDSAQESSQRDIDSQLFFRFLDAFAFSSSFANCLISVVTRTIQPSRRCCATTIETARPSIHR